MSKILRKYGKRSLPAPNTQDELPRKRRRIDVVDDSFMVQSPIAINVNSIDKQPPPIAEIERPETPRTSIRRFFRPTQSAPCLESSSSQPPSSPRIFSDQSQPSASSPPSSPLPCTLLEDISSTKTHSMSTTPPLDTTDTGLKEGTDNIHNRGRRRLQLRANLASCEKQSSSRPKDTSSMRTKSQTQTQTTLSLTRKQTYAECAFCNMVWVTTNQKDVQSHKRRHAAELRKRSKVKEVDP